MDTHTALNSSRDSISSLDETDMVTNTTQDQSENNSNENTSRGSHFDDAGDRNEYFDYSDEWADDLNNFVPQNTADLGYLHPNTNCTVHDAFLMIYIFSTRHGLTWEAVEDLARLVNHVIGQEKIAPSKYVFKQKFQKNECRPVKHFVCHKCELYLGTLSDLKESQQQRCSNCSAPIQIDTKYKKKSFPHNSNQKSFTRCTRAK